MSKLSPIMGYALKILNNAIRDIMSGECSEEEVLEIVTKLNPENKGYVKASDYCNVDEAIKILNIPYNRNKLFLLTKKYGIENHKFRNMPIGFKRVEIEILKQKLDKEKKKNKKIEKLYNSIDI